MRLYARRIREASTEELRTVLRFFDHDSIRHHYTGLIADLRAELKRREVRSIEPVRK